MILDLLNSDMAFLGMLFSLTVCGTLPSTTTQSQTAFSRRRPGIPPVPTRETSRPIADSGRQRQLANPDVARVQPRSWLGLTPCGNWLFLINRSPAGVSMVSTPSSARSGRCEFLPSGCAWAQSAHCFGIPRFYGRQNRGRILNCSPSGKSMNRSNSVTKSAERLAE